MAQRSNLPGANHASEIPYVFASQDTIPVYSKEIVPEDRALAALMHACWVAFAKGDSPKCPGQAWPAYSPAKDQLLEFGQSVGVREHFRKTQLDQLERLELGRLAKPSAP